MEIRGNYFKRIPMKCPKCLTTFGADDVMRTVLEMEGKLLAVYCPICWDKSEDHRKAVEAGQEELNTRLLEKRVICRLAADFIKT